MALALRGRRRILEGRGPSFVGSRLEGRRNHFLGLGFFLGVFLPVASGFFSTGAVGGGAMGSTDSFADCGRSEGEMVRMPPRTMTLPSSDARKAGQLFV